MFLSEIQDMRDIYQLKSYFYHLPSELVAHQPLAHRDQARLLIIDRAQGIIHHDTFNHLNNYLPPNSHLVVNDSKVIPARLLGHRSTGGAVEVFLLEPLEGGYSWEVLLRPLKKIHEGEKIDFGTGISAILENKEKRIVRFNKKNIIRYLSKVGHMPLPPYIKRQDTTQDREDYQTVYAKHSGSVASPTAGLHFSKELIKKLKAHGHRFLELTLHINYTTFKPVECADIRTHLMYTEHYSIKPAVASVIARSPQGDEAISKRTTNSVEITTLPEFTPECLSRGVACNDTKLVAVGTTSCRVLESVYKSQTYTGTTDLFIYPGYKFQMVDALITNFHLPYSTLLMLVCAFGGYDLVMKAYKEAINKRYRFYSYGDAMLIL